MKISFVNFTISLTTLYILIGIRGLHRLMYPLKYIDVDSYEAYQLVKPFWQEKTFFSARPRLKIYISTSPTFNVDFIIDEHKLKRKKDAFPAIETKDQTILLWEEYSHSRTLLPFTKSFILWSNDESIDSQRDKSFIFARQWLDDNKDLNGGLFEYVSSSKGESMPSISWNLFNFIRNLWRKDRKISKLQKNNTVIHISQSSSFWSYLYSNNTVYIHVILERDSKPRSKKSFRDDLQSFQYSLNRHNIIHGDTNLIKFQKPLHISRPKRKLYLDLLYMVKRVLFITNSNPPWDISLSQSKEYITYQNSIRMKQRNEGYPYWKPEVSIKFIHDTGVYPLDYMSYSGMNLIKTDKASHISGFAYIPVLYVDEIGMTSDKYIPMNDTITALPLRITFDNGGLRTAGYPHKFSTSGLNPARWRLISSLSQSMETIDQLGLDLSDIDDIRRLIADTSVTLLAVIIIASTLHLMFELLTLKNEVEFWNSTKNLTGLSVRTLFLDCIGQIIICLYLIEMNSSILVTGPSAIGCIISLWKCQKGLGLRFIHCSKETNDNHDLFSILNNVFYYTLNYKLVATRLSFGYYNGQNNTLSHENFSAITDQIDRLATRTLGYYFLLPLVLLYASYSLINHSYSTWFSYLITTLSSAVYGLGFVSMTPQLFLNYRLRSVAHLPWKVLIYRFINTFIDDLFSFLLRMPTMARIGCFRDDLIFLIYLYQRWLYPVDTSRPEEGGGIDVISSVAGTTLIDDIKSNDNKKKI